MLWDGSGQQTHIVKDFLWGFNLLSNFKFLGKQKYIDRVWLNLKSEAQCMTQKGKLYDNGMRTVYICYCVI